LPIAQQESGYAVILLRAAPLAPDSVRVFEKQNLFVFSNKFANFAFVKL
jgi:hypothetical protein